jgi:hypothetical protein
LQEVTAFVDETYNQNEKRAKEVEWVTKCTHRQSGYPSKLTQFGILMTLQGPGDTNILCILEGLRWTQSKPLNYAQFTSIKQELEETPSTFLNRLREALARCTTTSPDSWKTN